MKTLFSLVIVFLLGTQIGVAQIKQLSVYKKNGQLGKRYYEGDLIQLKLGSKEWLTGEIDWLLKDSIVVAGFKIGLNQIVAVRRTNGFALGAAANLGLASVLWPGIVFINGLSSNSRPLITNSALLSSAAMLGGAAVLLSFGRKTYKTDAPNKLRIIDFNLNPTTPTNHVPSNTPVPQSE